MLQSAFGNKIRYFMFRHKIVWFFILFGKHYHLTPFGVAGYIDAFQLIVHCFTS